MGSRNDEICYQNRDSTTALNESPGGFAGVPQGEKAACLPESCCLSLIFGPCFSRRHRMPCSLSKPSCVGGLGRPRSEKPRRGARPRAGDPARRHAKLAAEGSGSCQVLGNSLAMFRSFSALSASIFASTKVNPRFAALFCYLQDYLLSKSI